MKKILIKTVLIVAAMLSCLNMSAQKSVVTVLNKHNFEATDTIRFTTAFSCFESDPIVGDVYADLIAPNDSVVMSTVMQQQPDGTYEGHFCLPGTGFEKHSDIKKLSQYITISNGYIYAEGKPVILLIDDKKYWNGEYFQYCKIPTSEITYLAFGPRYKNLCGGISRSHEHTLIVSTKKRNDNIFRIRVTANNDVNNIESIEPITIQTLKFVPFVGNEKELPSSDNFLVSIPLKEKLNKIH